MVTCFRQEIQYMFFNPLNQPCRPSENLSRPFKNPGHSLENLGCPLENPWRPLENLIRPFKNPSHPYKYQCRPLENPGRPNYFFPKNKFLLIWP